MDKLRFVAENLDYLNPLILDIVYRKMVRCKLIEEWKADIEESKIDPNIPYEVIRERLIAQISEEYGSIESYRLKKRFENLILLGVNVEIMSDSQIEIQITQDGLSDFFTFLIYVVSGTIKSNNREANEIISKYNCRASKRYILNIKELSNLRIIRNQDNYTLFLNSRELDRFQKLFEINLNVDNENHYIEV